MTSTHPYGTLVLHIHYAEHLMDVQTFGKQDPYVVVKCGKNKFKTPVCANGGRTPNWEVSYCFNLNGKDDVMHFKVKDREVTKDRKIARADIPLRQLIEPNGRKSVNLVATNNFSKHAGVLWVSTTFTHGAGGYSKHDKHAKGSVTSSYPVSAGYTVGHAPPPTSSSQYPGTVYQQPPQQQHHHAYAPPAGQHYPGAAPPPMAVGHSPYPPYPHQQPPQPMYAPQPQPQPTYAPAPGYPAQQYQPAPVAYNPAYPQQQPQPVYSQPPQQPAYSPQPYPQGPPPAGYAAPPPTYPNAPPATAPQYSAAPPQPYTSAPPANGYPGAYPRI
jgi:hypothetical protein